MRGVSIAILTVLIGVAGPVLAQQPQGRGAMPDVLGAAANGTARGSQVSSAQAISASASDNGEAKHVPGRPTSLGSISLGTLQRAWENPMLNMEASQCAPGTVCFDWEENFVMPVRARILLTTYVQLPEWEEAVDVDYIGKDADEEGRSIKVEMWDRAKNVVKVTASHFDQDGNFAVLGRSGRVYQFHVMVYSTDEKVLTDQRVRVKAFKPADWRAVPVEPLKSSSAVEKSVLAPANKDYLRAINIDFEKLDCDDFDVYAKDSNSEAIKPAGVCHDGIYTIIDFGEEADSIKGVVAYEVVDKIDSKIDPHWSGARNQLLILHTVSELISYGNGEKVICLKKKTPIRAKSRRD